MQTSIFKKFLFFIFLFIFCIGFASIRPVPDNDLWARLIAGGHIIEKLSIIKNDFLSYTPTRVWYDHEWGASAIFYCVLKYLGESGLIFLRGFLVFLTLIFCFLTVNERKDEHTMPYNLLYFIFMFFAAISSTGPVIRCLLFTSLFFAVSIYILERAKNKKNKTLFLLPLLMIFWCNIHGGCLSLLGILFIYSAGEFLNGKDYKKYIYSAISCFIAMFINPYGVNYVKFLFEAGTMDRSIITEWLSPFIHNYMYSYIPYKIYLIVIIFFMIFSFILSKRKNEPVDKTKYLTVFAMLFLSILKIRFIGFFVFTAGALLYNDIYSVINFLSKKIRKYLKEDILKIIYILKEIIVYSLVFIFAGSLLMSEKKIEITSTKYPRYAVEFIKLNKLKGNLFVNFDFGSYCAYKLYPDNKIVMDGRYEEVYNPELLTELKNFHLVKENWDKIIKDYPPDVMIIEKRYPVYEKLISEGKYIPVFENNLSGVFVPANKAEKEYIYPPISNDYYNKTLFKTDIDFMKINKKKFKHRF